MAQNNQKREDYVNSIFAKRVWTGQNGSELISLGIKKKDFLVEFEKLKVNGDGFVNLTMGTRKDDTKKFSVWPDDYNKNSSQKSNASVSQSTAPTPSTSSTSVVEDDDLPF